MPAIAGSLDREEKDSLKCIERMMRMMTHHTQGKYELFRTSKVQIAGRAGMDQTAFLRHRVIAVFEGHLYHPEKLQMALQEKGRTCQDASVEGLLAAAYLEWGEDCLKRMHGDFVCAIFDIEKNVLILARDPLAKRPLYWFRDAERFLFASELKALLATHYIPSHICVEGLATYFALGYYPLEGTPLMGVYKLLPGYFLRIGPEWTPTTHYFGSSVDELNAGSAQIGRTGSVQQVLQENFKIQQASCHSIGCILSGGIGSVVLAHLLAISRSDQRIHTWVVEWEGDLSQSANQLSQVAHDLSIPCDVVVLRPTSILQDMLSMVWYLDEPVINMEVWMMWKVAQMGSTSTEALYCSFGLDNILPFAHERQRMDVTNSVWKASYEKMQSVLHKGMNEIMQKMPQKIRMKWVQYNNQAPESLGSFHATCWSNNRLLEQAAPELMRHFNEKLFLLQTECVKGMGMFLEPYVHLYFMTEIISGMSQPAEKLFSAFGVNCVTPYSEQNILLLLGDLFKKDLSSLTQQLYQILLHALPPKDLSGLTINRRIPLPLWSDHPGFIQAFETLQEGILVRSGWVLRTWLSAVLENSERRKASFGFLLAMLQWEIWYKMFIEEPPHEHPSSLSITQFLHR